MRKDQDLKGKIAQLPDLPGVYLMKDAQGEIIYCGKAISLKKRVSSYFRPATDPNPRRGLLTAQIRDIEFIITGSELEALILESNLIKKHRPRFNVLLRDDKHYPHLCITLNEPFPKLKVVRRVKKDGSVCFGPYIPANAMRQTLRLIHQIFPLRRCTGPLPRNRKRPCLNHQIGLCRAPCVGLISPAEYQGLIREVILFLKGKKEDLVRMLKTEMAKAADEHRYEEAARLRGGRWRMGAQLALPYRTAIPTLGSLHLASEHRYHRVGRPGCVVLSCWVRLRLFSQSAVSPRLQIS